MSGKQLGIAALTVGRGRRDRGKLWSINIQFPPMSSFKNPSMSESGKAKCKLADISRDTAESDSRHPHCRTHPPSFQSLSLKRKIFQPEKVEPQRMDWTNLSPVPKSEDKETETEFRRCRLR